MNDKVFDAELRSVFPDACRLDFAVGRDEPLCQHIYEHPDTASVIERWPVGSVIEEMDRAGVSAGLLSGLPWRDRGIHDAHNAYIQDCLRCYPDRFKGLFMAYPDEPERVADEIMQLDARYYVGVEIIPKWQAVTIDDDALAPILDALQARDMFLKAYTAHVTQTLDGDSPYRLLQLLKKRPALKVLAPHLGGMLCLYGLMPGIRELLQNTYFISSVTATMKLTHFAVEVNADNVLFGTDFPFNYGHEIRQPLDEVRRLGLTPDELAKLLWGNAAGLFGL